ncbi:MAG: 4Fe-4S dicluster domain-containing protein [Desulfosarcinaceae bacterium]|jgi:heterodisulfide reductase subunit C/nitrate reductase gamma subunit
MLFQTALYLAAVICLAGLLWRAYQWLSIDIGPEPAGGPVRRCLAVAKGLVAAVFNKRLFVVAGALIRDALLQLHLLKNHPLRWLMHQLLFWGFILLLLFHAFDDQLTLRLFSDYAPTLNPFLFLRNLMGLLVLAGILIALGRRYFIPAQKRVTAGADWVSLALLAAIILSGFLAEAAQIVSEPIFDQMVADYHGDDDSEAVAALKAVWSREYHVVFDPPAAVTAELLTTGAELNEESCMACHSHPTAAVGSLPLAMLLKPVAPSLNRVRGDLLLWHLHYLLCFIGLALLPFTKFRHLVTTPLTLTLRAIDSRPASPPNLTPKTDPATVRFNRKTRRALALDACTHCGACSGHCSVAPSAEVLANPLILPSEKLVHLRQNLHLHLPDEGPDRFSEGSFICTECGRCTRHCPSGLDLQDLWRAGKADLVAQKRPDLHTRAVQTASDVLLEAITAHPKRTDDGSVSALMPPLWADDGMDLSNDPATFQACVQCAVCSSVCPVVAAAGESEQDPEIGPHLVTNLLRLGQPDLAQVSRMVWSCVTCYQCQDSCPQHIRVADLLCELRNKAWSRLKQAPPNCWCSGSAKDAS